MSKTFPAKPILKGKAQGPALFTDRSVNFTAAFTKPENLLWFKKAEVRDRHHPWFKENVKGKVLVIPAAIGSTHTGLVLLDLVRMKNGPAAIIVGAADPLLVSGVVLSEVWYDESIPIVECPIEPIAEAVKNGEVITVDGDAGVVSAG
ncbi:MAG: DUF126 domain-containing protein [Candidatus Hydrogenedens sp.]|nr:DUF126 domain-containing protein [Candidatus Hydrogenedens sp.]